MRFSAEAWCLEYTFSLNIKVCTTLLLPPRAKEDSFDKLSRLNNLFDVVSPSLHCYFYFSTFWTPPVSSKRTSWQRGEATLFVDSKLLSVQSKLCVTAWQWRSLGSGKEKLGTNLLLSQRITKENGVKTIAMLTLLLFFVKALVLQPLGLMLVHGILILDVYQLESSVSQSFFCDDDKLPGNVYYAGTNVGNESVGEGRENCTAVIDLLPH